MQKLLEGLKELKPFQLRERANLVDMQVATLQAQINELRDIKKAIRDEQLTRKGEGESDDA